jgi:hypothetical protein
MLRHATRQCSFAGLHGTIAVAFAVAAHGASAQTLTDVILTLRKLGCQRVIFAESHRDSNNNAALAQILGGATGGTSTLWFEGMGNESDDERQALTRQIRDFAQREDAIDYLLGVHFHELPGVKKDQRHFEEFYRLPDSVALANVLRTPRIAMRPLFFYSRRNDMQAFLDASGFAVGMMGALHAEGVYSASHGAFNFAGAVVSPTQQLAAAPQECREKDFAAFPRAADMQLRPALVRLNTTFSSVDMQGWLEFYLHLGMPVLQVPVRQGLMANVVMHGSHLPGMKALLNRARPNPVTPVNLVCTGIAGCGHDEL